MGTITDITNPSGGGQSFDQSLNTTDSPTFDSITLTNQTLGGFFNYLGTYDPTTNLPYLGAFGLFATKIIQDITFTNVGSGVVGNTTTIEYVAGGTDRVLATAVLQDITATAQCSFVISAQSAATPNGDWKISYAHATDLTSSSKTIQDLTFTINGWQ